MRTLFFIRYGSDREIEALLLGNGTYIADSEGDIVRKLSPFPPPVSVIVDYLHDERKVLAHFISIYIRSPLENGTHEDEIHGES